MMNCFKDASAILPSSLYSSLHWCGVCFVIHGLWMLLSQFIPDYAILKPKIQREWHNRGVSIFHAIVMFSTTINYWLHINNTMTIEPESIPYVAHALDTMMGYLWYDIVIELSTTRKFDTLGHHFLGLFSHLSSRLSNNGAAGFYSMLVYIAEGSTPFLHTSWLLHNLKWSKSLVFTICSGLLIVTFFVFRVILGPYMVWHLVLHRDEWGTSGRDALYWGNFSAVSLFAVLNYYWFYMLMKIALGGSSATASKTKRKIT